MLLLVCENVKMIEIKIMRGEEYGIGIEIMREKGNRWYEETRRSFRRSKARSKTGVG
jgi:hypothetical protein